MCRMKVVRDCWQCEYEDCGHVWLASGEIPPKMCAKCRRRRWSGRKAGGEGVAVLAELRGPKKKGPKSVSMADVVVEEAPLVVEKKVKERPRCKRCGGALSVWGPLNLRCLKCNVNYPK